MKRLYCIIVFAAAGFFAVPKAQAQLLVGGTVELGALTQSIMQATRIEQVVYYIQMIQQQVQAATNTYNQFQAIMRAEKRALENLKGIKNVNSYSDFMGWYNRQLDLEREMDSRWKNLNIQIGGSSYHIKDIQDIPKGIEGAYGSDYWEKEFTPEQRKAMWHNLGLSPANYAYQNTWASREESLGTRILLRRGFINEENATALERWASMLEESGKEETGEKMLLQAALDVAVDTNTKIRESLEDNAAWREYEYSRHRLANTPVSPLRLSDSWNRGSFSQIVEGSYID